MKKTVTVPVYGDSAHKDIEMEVTGDWGYHPGTDEENYVWVNSAKGRVKRKGPYYTVTHTPSGLMAADHLPKSRAQRMVKELSLIDVRWDGINKSCDPFLRAAREIVLKYT